MYYENKCHDVLKNVLENDVNTAIVWFDNNYMCANPDKFQSIILDRHSAKNTKDINVFKKNITEWCHSRQCISLDVF